MRGPFYHKDDVQRLMPFYEGYHVDIIYDDDGNYLMGKWSEPSIWKVNVWWRAWRGSE